MQTGERYRVLPLAPNSAQRLCNEAWERGWRVLAMPGTGGWLYLLLEWRDEVGRDWQEPLAAEASLDGAEESEGT